MPAASTRRSVVPAGTPASCLHVGGGKVLGARNLKRSSMVNTLGEVHDDGRDGERRHRGAECAKAHQVALVGPPRPRAVVSLGKVAYAHRCEPGAGRRGRMGGCGPRGGRDPPRGA